MNQGDVLDESLDLFGVKAVFSRKTWMRGQEEEGIYSNAIIHACILPYLCVCTLSHNSEGRGGRHAGIIISLQ